MIRICCDVAASRQHGLSRRVLVRLAGLVALGIWASAAQAQESIYRCGNTYTNQPSVAAMPTCVRITGGNLTVVQAGRGAAPAAKPAASAPAHTAAGASRVASEAQRARDVQARQILQDELQKALVRRDAAARAYQNGEPERLGEETRNYQKYLDRVAGLKDALNRAQSDVAGLQRELARLPAGGVN